MVLGDSNVPGLFGERMSADVTLFGGCLKMKSVLWLTNNFLCVLLHFLVYNLTLSREKGGFMQ